MLDSFAQGTTGISNEEKIICWEALRSPLLTLINTVEVIIDGDGQIPHDDYMQLRNDVCRDAYHVSTSTHQLILFSLYGDERSLGIGLPLAQRLAISMGYDIFLDTEFTSGARFVVTGI